MKIFTSVTVLFISLWPLTVVADNVSSSNKKGIDSYDKKNYEESVNSFTEALVEQPDSPVLKYNLGTALIELGKKEEALYELSSAAQLSKDNIVSTSAHFNAGNMLFKSNDFEGAINEYKQALKLDQSSKDIRQNLELAVNKLHEQQQKKKEENKDGEKKEENNKDKQDNQDGENKEENEDKQNDDDQNKDEKPEDKEQNEKEQKDQQQNNQQQDNEQQSDQQQHDQQQHDQQQDQLKSEDRPMTPEEAQRLLDAINDEEKKALSFRRMKMKTDTRHGDDW